MQTLVRTLRRGGEFEPLLKNVFVLRQIAEWHTRLYGKYSVHRAFLQHRAYCRAYGNDGSNHELCLLHPKSKEFTIDHTDHGGNSIILYYVNSVHRMHIPRHCHTTFIRHRSYIFNHPCLPHLFTFYHVFTEDEQMAVLEFFVNGQVFYLCRQDGFVAFYPSQDDNVRRLNDRTDHEERQWLLETIKARVFDYIVLNGEMPPKLDTELVRLAALLRKSTTILNENEQRTREILGVGSSCFEYKPSARKRVRTVHSFKRARAKRGAR